MSPTMLNPFGFLAVSCIALPISIERALLVPIFISLRSLVLGRGSIKPPDEIIGARCKVIVPFGPTMGTIATPSWVANPPAATNDPALALTVSSSCVGSTRILSATIASTFSLNTLILSAPASGTLGIKSVVNEFSIALKIVSSLVFVAIASCCGIAKINSSWASVYLSECSLACLTVSSTSFDI